jgi:hypothetical protein
MTKEYIVTEDKIRQLEYLMQGSPHIIAIKELRTNPVGEKK